MKIKVLSREAVEKFKAGEPYIIISITDPNSEPVNFIGNPKSILSLQFTDIDHRVKKQENCKMCDGTGKSKLFPDVNDGHCYACTDKMDIVLFDNEMANQILEFVEKYSNQVNLIVVQCEAGISRSAGVAGALSLLFNKTDQYYFDHYLPNMLVYRKILNAYFNF